MENTAKILDGKKAREALLPQLAEKIRGVAGPIGLAIIQVGDRPDSTAFIRSKKAFAARLGVREQHIQVEENVTQNELLEIIKKLNDSNDVHGIIVQLPMPLHIDRDAVIDAIDPKKDVDGLTSHNVKGWLGGREDAIMPATARGVKELLKHYDIDLFGKRVTIIGRSMLVGKPLAAMCLNENATVMVCHSKSADLTEDTKMADIIISAVGRPGLINAKHVRSGQIVIDVGITRTGENKLVGDVDFESVKDIVAAITPVPGGVGQMTVFALFENLIELVAS